MSVGRYLGYRYYPHKLEGANLLPKDYLPTDTVARINRKGGGITQGSSYKREELTLNNNMEPELDLKQGQNTGSGPVPRVEIPGT